MHLDHDMQHTRLPTLAKGFSLDILLHTWTSWRAGEGGIGRRVAGMTGTDGEVDWEVLWKVGRVRVGSGGVGWGDILHSLAMSKIS